MHCRSSERAMLEKYRKGEDGSPEVSEALE